MKRTFSTSWKRSAQARKQRKFAANAPQHATSKLLHAALSKDLRAKHKTRSVRVRSGDEVEVLRGSFKGSSGVVDRVDTTGRKLIIRGVDHAKRDGSKTPYPVTPSNVRIVKLADDQRRFKGGKA